MSKLTTLQVEDQWKEWVVSGKENSQFSYLSLLKLLQTRCSCYTTPNNKLEKKKEERREARVRKGDLGR